MHSPGLTAIDWQAWLRGLGREMRDLREALHLSQRDLARLAGVSQGAVSRFEVGKGSATPAYVVLKMAGALTQHSRAVELSFAQTLRGLLEGAVQLVDPAPPAR